MEKYFWQQTLLEQYRDYRVELGTLDRKMDKMVRQGFGYNSDTLAFLNEMRTTVLKKKNCEIAKKLVENALLKDSFEKSVLYWRYICGKQFNEISVLLNKPIRHIFRQREKELLVFASALAVQGYNDEKLEKEFGGDPYFKKPYQKLLEKSANFSKKNLVQTVAVGESLINVDNSRISHKSKCKALQG